MFQPPHDPYTELLAVVGPRDGPGLVERAAGRAGGERGLRAKALAELEQERLHEAHGCYVDVEQAFMHCSKSLVRSRLWSPDTWEHASDAPTLAQWVKSTVDTNETLEEVQGNHDRDRETRLY
jgi:hypothetical protein